MLEEKSRVIFLDIDGVIQPYWTNVRFKHDLNQLLVDLSQKYNDDVYLTMNRYDVGACYYDWDKGAVELLRGCFEKFSTVAVISSDWKNFNSLRQLKALFRLYDLDKYIVDTVEKGIEKYKLIRKYLKENYAKVTAYAIVDDMYKSMFDNDPHMVETSNKLNEENVKAIEKALSLVMEEIS